MPQDSLRTAVALVSRARRIVALTGAGISTESGIPDFRGPKGVWTLNPKAEKLSDIRYYMADPEVRRLAWQERLAHPAWTAKANAGHMALVEMEKNGRLHALITQNIDGLHQRAGNSSQKVIEVHGTVHEGRGITTHDEKRDIMFSYFNNLLGSPFDRSSSLNLEIFHR